MRKLSDQGLQFLKYWEGLPGTAGEPALDAYLGQEGKWTIGWGHTLNVKQGHTVTPQEAEVILAGDLGIHQKAVSDTITRILTENQYAALVAFSFNCGAKAFRTSTLAKKINAGDFVGAGKEFERWVFFHDRESGEVRRSDGLLHRRIAERKLFEAH